MPKRPKAKLTTLATEVSQNSLSNIMRWAHWVIVLTTLHLLSACTADQSVKKVLRVGHTLDVNHPVHLALQFMADDLKERSNGELGLKIYSSGQLGSERELIELLQIGAVDITKVSASPLEGFAPEMGVFGLPYLFKDSDHYWRVLNGKVGRELLATLEKKRLIGLGFFDAGSRSFYSTKELIKSPESLAGKKIRVMNSRMAVDAMRTLGGAATPISWGEVYTSLQQGLVDAAENNPPTFYSSRHYEVAPFFTLDEHTSIPDVILLSKKTTQRLSATQNQWLRESMHEATQYQRSIWAQATKDALAAVEASGVKIFRPDKSKFQQAVRPMYREIENVKLQTFVKKIQVLGEI